MKYFRVNNLKQAIDAVDILIEKENLNKDKLVFRIFSEYLVNNKNTIYKTILTNYTDEFSSIFKVPDNFMLLKNIIIDVRCRRTDKLLSEIELKEEK